MVPMKERCSTFDIRCDYTSTCYFIRPERCFDSMSKVDIFRKLWEEKYGSPMEEVLDDIKNETNRKRVENFVIKSFVAEKSNK